MAADHVDGEKSTFRCLDAARYVVAAAVTVLIVTVIAYAVVLIFRPDSLTLVVDGGFVSVRRDPNYVQHGKPQGPSLVFTFSVTAINTSGRSRLSFTNITATFSGKNASGDYEFLLFDFLNMTVAQQSALTSNAQANSNRDNMEMSYFDSMYKNLTSNISTTIPNGMLQLDGYLTVMLYGVYSQQSTHVFYYCWPLTIGNVDPSEREDSTDVECTGTPPATLPIST